MTEQPDLAGDDPSSAAVHDAELNATPYEHTLPDGTTISIPHEVTLPSIGKDEANDAALVRGTRGLAVALMRLALEPAEFARLQTLADKEFFALFDGWMKHCGLRLGEPSASTS